MRHHRNAACHQKLDGARQRLIGFQLDGITTRARQHLGAIAKGLLVGFLVTAKRHVSNDTGQARAIDHRTGVADDVFELHAQGRWPSVTDHGRGVADQDEVHQRVDQRGDGAGIGGQGDDFLLALHRHQLRDGHTFGAGVDAHQCLPLALDARVLHGPIIGEARGDSMHRSALKSDPGKRSRFFKLVSFAPSPVG